MDSLADQPGQLLFAGLPGLDVPDELASLIASGRVGGVTLFARNIGTPDETRALIRRLHDLAPQNAPLCVAIDQEGGRVQRLRDPWTEFPPMRVLGERGDLADTGAVAEALGRELGDAGFDLDFAPCCDVDSNPDNPVIGDRSFARTSADVGRHAKAFIAGLQATGVAACAKHFPGHGDANVDSHLSLPRLDLSLERLRKIELPPFAAAAAADVACMMTAHVVIEPLDPDWPATLSPKAIGLLRDEIGYDGLVFTDDLEMKAVADHHSPGEIVDRALGAGVDAFLVCSRDDLRDAILGALEATPAARLETSLDRMARFKRRWLSRGAEPTDPPGPPYPRPPVAGRATGLSAAAPRVPEEPTSHTRRSRSPC